MLKPCTVTPNENEARIAYLVRVLKAFMDSTSAGGQTIIYDDTKCDGRCLADDIAAELQWLDP